MACQLFFFLQAALQPTSTFLWLLLFMPCLIKGLVTPRLILQELSVNYCCVLAANETFSKRSPLVSPCKHAQLHSHMHITSGEPWISVLEVKLSRNKATNTQMQQQGQKFRTGRATGCKLQHIYPSRGQQTPHTNRERSNVFAIFDSKLEL